MNNIEERAECIRLCLMEESFACRLADPSSYNILKTGLYRDGELIIQTKDIFLSRNDRLDA